MPMDETLAASSKQQIILITGERQIGKSTLCRELVLQLEETGLEIAGLLTYRTGPHDLAVQEIRSGLHYPLTLPFGSRQDGPALHFTMDPEAIARSAQALNDSLPAQVLIIDELGPLEFKFRQGWVLALELLKQPLYSVAVVVIRPELLLDAMEAFSFPWYTVVHLTMENREMLAEQILPLVLKTLALVAR